MPVRMITIVGRGLVDAHGIRKRSLENIVVAHTKPDHGVGQIGPLLRVHVEHGPQVDLGQDHGLKRPERPERHQGHKRVVLEDDALTEPQLGLQVGTEQTAPLVLQMRGLTLALGGRVHGHGLCGPYLAVGMGVGASHDSAPVLENLDMADVVASAQVRELLAPQVHHLDRTVHAATGQGQIVTWGIADDPANAGLRLGHQQIVADGLMHGRLFRQEGGKIVGKDKGVGVVGIDRSPGPCVAGTQVALGIVGGQGRQIRLFLLPLPGTLGPVR